MADTVLAGLGPEPSIVLVRLRSLGDTVLSTPAFALLRRTVPKARIHVAMDTRCAGVLEEQPDIDGVLHAPSGRGLGARVRLLRQIRTLRPDLCIDMHGGSTAAWLTALSGARWRAGFRHFRRHWAYNVRIPRAQEVLGRTADAKIHTAEHHAAAVIHLGADDGKIPPARLATKVPRPTPPYAVIHPSAAYRTKEWSIDRFRDLAAKIGGRHGLRPIFLLGPGEESTAPKLSEFDLRQGLAMPLLLSLLARARLFVGNDSGPAHIAASYGVPCVVVFGSSDSGVWHPWRTPYRVVETPWECKPCPGDRCYAFDEPHCILSVGLDDVSLAVSDLLAEVASTS